MAFNKRVDRLESGPNNPKSPNDEVIWVDTDNNTIKRYNETNSSWVSVGGQGGAADTGDITFNGVQIIGAGTASGDGANLGTIELVPDGDLTSDQYLIIDPTAPNHIHIRAGGEQDASTADLIIGAENTNVLVSDTGDYVDIRTTSDDLNTYIWRFSSDGYLSGPAMGGLFVSGILNGDNDLWLSSGSNVVISSGEGMGVFLENQDDPDNQIATIGDLASSLDYISGSAAAGIELPSGNTTVMTTQNLSVGIWQVFYTQTVRVTGGQGNQMVMSVNSGTANFTALSPKISSQYPPNNYSTYTLNTLINVTSPGNLQLDLYNNSITMEEGTSGFGPATGYYAIKIA